VHLLLVQEVPLYHSSWNKQCKTRKDITKLQYKGNEMTFWMF